MKKCIIIPVHCHLTFVRLQSWVLPATLNHAHIYSNDHACSIKDHACLFPCNTFKGDVYYKYMLSYSVTYQFVFYPFYGWVNLEKTFLVVRQRCSKELHRIWRSTIQTTAVFLRECWRTDRHNDILCYYSMYEAVQFEPEFSIVIKIIVMKIINLGGMFGMCPSDDTPRQRINNIHSSMNLWGGEGAEIQCNPRRVAGIKLCDYRSIKLIDAL